MDSLTIKNAEEAWEYIGQDIEGLVKDLPGIKFEGWPQFSLKVEGDKYHSTLPATMLPSLYELQLAIYRIYAEITNRNVKNLSQQERQSLEIVFKIQEGSSDVKADLTSAANAIAGSIAKLKPAHWVATAVAVAAIFASPDMYRAHNESGQPTEAEKIQMRQLDLQEKLIDKIPSGNQIKKEVEDATTSVLKSIQDADTVTLNTTTYTSQEVDEIVKTKPKTKKETRLDSNYLITGWKVREDVLKLDLTSIDSGENFPATLVKENLSFEDQDRLSKALAFEIPIGLKVFARVSPGNISSAQILGLIEKPEPEVVADANPVQIDEPHE